jgi:Tfp pilus assembly protein PilO
MYIAIAALVVVTLAVAFFLILPGFQEASSLDATIETENANLATAQALLARRQSAKAQSAANEVELMRIANEVPDSPQLPSVIIELQDLANASGVELRELAPGELVDAEPATAGAPVEYSRAPIDILLRCELGEWASLIDCLHRIQGLDRGVRITEITVTHIPATDTTPAYIEADVTLEVYVMASANVPVAPTPAASQSATPTPTTTTP